MFKNLITESMSKSPWLFHINAGSCNGCDIELVAVLTPRYDAERLGFKLTGTPRHADVVVVTGPVTKQVLPRVLRAISQVPEPRVIVTMGSCPQSGNVFRGSYSVAGPLSKYVDVDVDIAGCAPKPEAIIDGLAGADALAHVAVDALIRVEDDAAAVIGFGRSGRKGIGVGARLREELGQGFFDIREIHYCSPPS